MTINNTPGKYHELADTWVHWTSRERLQEFGRFRRVIYLSCLSVSVCMHSNQQLNTPCFTV